MDKQSLQSLMDSAIMKNLGNEFDWMIEKCKKKNIGIPTEFLAGNGRDTFIKLAIDRGYVLGQVFNTRLKRRADNSLYIDMDSIFFDMKKTIKAPWQRGKKKEIPNVVVNGFGLALDLRGWSFLSGMPMGIINQSILEGKSIEDLWVEYGCSRVLAVGGENMPEKDALEMAKIPVSWWRKRIANAVKSKGKPLSDTERQQLFDDMRAEFDSGCLHIYGERWIRISERDVGLLSEIAKQRGETLDETLHLMLNPLERK